MWACGVRRRNAPATGCHCFGTSIHHRIILYSQRPLLHLLNCLLTQYLISQSHSSSSLHLDTVQIQPGWSELIYWDFPIQPSLGFKEDSPKKKKYSVRSSGWKLSNSVTTFTSTVCRRASLSVQLIKPWNQWATAAEDHTNTTWLPCIDSSGCCCYWASFKHHSLPEFCWSIFLQPHCSRPRSPNRLKLTSWTRQRVHYSNGLQWAAQWCAQQSPQLPDSKWLLFFIRLSQQMFKLWTLRS